MLASSVTVIDYGIVNLANIVRALEFVGAKVQISDCPNEVSRASRIVLPGVGAFGAGMEKLKEKRLDEALKSNPDDRPLMGICLGMQMLLDMSTEFGEHTGLGIIAGTVTSLDSRAMGIEQKSPKVPHVGWRELQTANSNPRWRNSCLKHVERHDSVYFVHSYMAVPSHSDNVLATCEYGKSGIVAAIVKSNVVGLQFHPELSGDVGLRILEAFVNT